MSYVHSEVIAFAFAFLFCLVLNTNFKMGENKTMDSETLYRLERQAYFFYPYEISTLTKKCKFYKYFEITSETLDYFSGR